MAIGNEAFGDQGTMVDMIARFRVVRTDLAFIRIWIE